jgi:hypothetical protein
VVLTATAGYPSDVSEDIEPPVVDYLAKPFALTVLLESVRSALAKHGHEAPLRGRGQEVSRLQ